MLAGEVLREDVPLINSHRALCERRVTHQYSRQVRAVATFENTRACTRPAAQQEQPLTLGLAAPRLPSRPLVWAILNLLTTRIKRACGAQEKASQAIRTPWR